MTPLAVGATLLVHDSLQAGRSRFFAEISRIRRVADLAGRQPPALFLLDELFQGTNSHDRTIGAEALLLNLIDRGAIGLTTTHDLALTAIADQSAGRAVNVHFDDELKDGELIFDYRMKPGPVTHSNALALMKAVGLPVTPLVDWRIRRLEDSIRNCDLPIGHLPILLPPSASGDLASRRHAVPKPQIPQIRNALGDRDAARVARRPLAQLPRAAIDLDASDAIAHRSEICRAVHDVACIATEIRAIVEHQPRLPDVGVTARIVEYAAAVDLPRAKPTARIDEMRSFQPSDLRSSIDPLKYAAAAAVIDVTAHFPRLIAIDFDAADAIVQRVLAHIRNFVAERHAVAAKIGILVHRDAAISEIPSTPLLRGRIERERRCRQDEGKCKTKIIRTSVSPKCNPTCRRIC